MFDRKAALIAGINYLKKHPGELLHSARRARHLSLTIPVAALKWMASELTAGASGPQDVQIAACPPGLRVHATVEQMSTQIRASCVLNVERVTVGADAFELELRLKGVTLDVPDEAAQTPLAALIRSQTLDLTRVASLIAYLPSRPAVLVDAVDDRLVFDLMKVPRFSRDPRVRKILGLVSGILAVESVRVNEDHLEVHFRHVPGSIRALMRTRSTR